MRRLLPGRFELLLFAVLAVGLAAVVHTFWAQDTGLAMAGCGAPIFLVAAIMGLRRSPLWQNQRASRDQQT